MSVIAEALMAAFLDAASAALILHLAHRHAAAPCGEKLLCVMMLIGFILGMALGERQHAYAFLILCALGALLSYIAEGFAFSDSNAQEVTSHE